MRRQPRPRPDVASPAAAAGRARQLDGHSVRRVCFAAEFPRNRRACCAWLRAAVVPRHIGVPQNPRRAGGARLGGRSVHGEWYRRCGAAVVLCCDVQCLHARASRRSHEQQSAVWTHASSESAGARQNRSESSSMRDRALPLPALNEPPSPLTRSAKAPRLPIARATGPVLPLRFRAQATPLLHRLAGLRRHAQEPGRDCIFAEPRPLAPEPEGRCALPRALPILAGPAG